jgi:hypothetical protein
MPVNQQRRAGLAHQRSLPCRLFLVDLSVRPASDAPVPALIAGDASQRDQKQVRKLGPRRDVAEEGSGDGRAASRGGAGEKSRSGVGNVDRRRRTRSRKGGDRGNGHHRDGRALHGLTDRTARLAVG